MKCPKCDSESLKTTDSRNAKEQNSVRRRKECTECSYRFSTYEIIQDSEYDITIDLLSEGNNYPLKTFKKGSNIHNVRLDGYDIDRIKKSLDFMYKKIGLNNDIKI